MGVLYQLLPVGLVAFGACYVLLHDPEYLVKERQELRKQPLRFDGIGLSLLVIVMVSWEVMLSKGQEWDWLSDPFWRVQTLTIFFGFGLIALICWELRNPNPVVNFRPLKERNFAACCVIIFGAFAILYAASTSLPALLQSLFGYDALSAGLVMSPAGFGALLAMPLVGRALGKGADARWLLAGGLLTMAVANYWMSQMNLEISPGQVVWPRVMLVFGLSMCFAPANVAAYLYIPPSLRGAAVGLLSLLRNEGGSVEAPRWPRPCRSAVSNFMSCGLASISIRSMRAWFLSLAQARGVFLQQSGDASIAQQSALQHAREFAAAAGIVALAYFDVFLLLAASDDECRLLAVLLMKRSVAGERRPHRR